VERRQSQSPHRSKDEGFFRNRFRDLPVHLRSEQRKRATDTPLDEYATQRDHTALNRPGRTDGHPGRSSQAQPVTCTGRGDRCHHPPNRPIYVSEETKKWEMSMGTSPTECSTYMTLNVDMRQHRDSSSQQFRYMASLVSQLASEVLLLKSNSTPPATAADNDSLSPLLPKVAA